MNPSGYSALGHRILRCSGGADYDWLNPRSDAQLFSSRVPAIPLFEHPVLMGGFKLNAQAPCFKAVMEMPGDWVKFDLFS